VEDCCCSGEPGTVSEKCPECGTVGKAVSTRTLKQMVKPELLSFVDKPGFRFCRTATCKMVYFHSNGDRLEKKDVRVRVGLKEREDPVPVCYCFGFTEAMVREEIRDMGRCTIPERITAEIKAGHCACEIRNPQGSCCLGNVAAVVKRILEKPVGTNREIEPEVVGTGRK
jgi:CopZ-like zinc binding protein